MLTNQVYFFANRFACSTRPWNGAGCMSSLDIANPPENCEARTRTPGSNRSTPLVYFARAPANNIARQDSAALQTAVASASSPRMPCGSHIGQKWDTRTTGNPGTCSPVRDNHPPVTHFPQGFSSETQNPSDPTLRHPRETPVRVHPVV